MKAKVVHTGEVINVTWNGVCWYYEEEGNYRWYKSDEIEPIEYTDEELGIYGSTLLSGDSGIDWERRRYEIAKTMLPSVDAKRKYRAESGGYEFDETQAARAAVRFADALIKELKK